MNGSAQHILKEALCGEAGASSPRTLADACWVLRVGWKIGVLLQEDDSDADAQELVKFFALLDSVQRASLEVQTKRCMPSRPRAFGCTCACAYIHPFLCPRVIRVACVPAGAGHALAEIHRDRGA